MVFLMEPSSASVISLKVGNMCLNRFCIEEDAAFELSGVYYLRESSDDMVSEGIFTNNILTLTLTIVFMLVVIILGSIFAKI